MTGLYKFSLILIVFFAVIVFFILFYISAPYGKFLRKGWGPSVRSKWAWMIMELPSPLLMAVFFFTSQQQQFVQIVFITLWLSHYLYRTFIYPFSQSGHDKPYPVILILMAFTFNCLNGFINGYYHFSYFTYPVSWIKGWQFITGFIIFIAGFVINKIADDKLRRMRKDNPDVYVIPEGWLFNYISSPHYFGEIIEWAGWALLTGSPAGLAFALFTFANLFPRAWASHKWYRSNFPDYPKNRKALIPFLI